MNKHYIKILLCLFIFLTTSLFSIFSSSIDYISPPTPDNSSVYSSPELIEIEIAGENDLQDFDFDWNSQITNYYDSSLVLMQNLNNNSNLSKSSSQVVDSSIYNHSGTLQGNAAFNTFSQYQGSVYFDGTDDWIEIPDDTTLDSTSQFTFQAWVYDTRGDTQPRAIASKRVSSSSSQAWSIFKWDSEYIYFDVNGERDGSGVALPSNQWVHLTVVFDGTLPSTDRKKFYYDGDLVSTQESSETSISRQASADITIGILNKAYGQSWEGYIDEVRIYDRALSDDEINQSYYSNLRQVDSDLWKFQANQTNLVEDNYTFQAAYSNSSQTSSTPQRIIYKTPPFFIDVFSPLTFTYLKDTILVNFTATNLVSSIDSLWYFNSTANRTYTASENVTLSDGDYQFMFYANDTTGTTVQEQVNFTINDSAEDTESPVLTINSPINSTLYGTRNISIDFSATDNDEVDSLFYFNGSQNVSYSSPTTITLENGNYEFIFYANDSSGNLAQEIIEFEVFEDKPSDFIVNFPPPSYITNEKNVTINISMFTTPISSSTLFFNSTNLTMYDSSLQLAYNFDDVSSIGDSSSKVVDVSEYERNGTLTTGSSYSTNSVFGKSISLSSSAVTTNSFAGLSSQLQATISGWVYQNTLSLDQYFLWANGNVLIQLGNSFDSPTGSDVLRVRWNLEGDWRTSHIVDSILTPGEWNHWTITFNSGTTKIYLNGEEIYSGIDSQTTISSNTPQYSFGERSGDYLDGLFDEVRIYNRALSADEIRLLSKTSLNKKSKLGIDEEWEILSKQTNLSEGVYEYKMYSTTQTGLSSSTQRQNFTVDFTNLNILFNNPNNNSLYSNNTQLLNISVLDSNLDSIWYNYNGINISYTSPIEIEFEVGVNNLTVWANDTFGAQKSKTISFEIEPLAQVILLSPLNNSKFLYNSSIALGFEINSSSSLTSSCEIIVNSITIDTISCNSSEINTYQFAPSNNTKKQHNWSVELNEGSGIDSMTNNFISIQNSHLKISKTINLVSTNLYETNIQIENFLTNQTRNQSIYEFIDNSFSAGSFSPAFESSSSINGADYDGELYTLKAQFDETQSVQDFTNVFSSNNQSSSLLLNQFIIGFG
ncbi:MAG: LamG domain-containing protein [Candidatus Nanoarchaeia archaeon]